MFEASLCRSFNFEVTTSSGLHTCELNSISAGDKPDMLMEEQNFTYYAIL